MYSCNIDIVKACKNVNIAMMVGRFSHKENMECKDVKFKNVCLFVSKMMKGEIEQIMAQGTFCLFFVTKDNIVMASKLLVPFDDPTLQMLVT
jgi:hypothetical protein